MTAGALILVFWALICMMGALCGLAFVAGLRGLQ